MRLQPPLGETENSRCDTSSAARRDWEQPLRHKLSETCTKCTLKVTAPQRITYCMIYKLHGAGHVTLTLAIRNCDGSRLNGWRARRPS